MSARSEIRERRDFLRDVQIPNSRAELAELEEILDDLDSVQSARDERDELRQEVADLTAALQKAKETK